MRKINKISVLLSLNGWQITTSSYLMEKKKLIYQGEGRNVREQDLMSILHNFYANTHKGIYYYTFCFDENIDDAKELLMQKIKSDLFIIKNELNIMESYI